MKLRQLGPVLGLVLAASVVPVPAAHAADTAVCVFEIVEVFSPGLSRTPAEQTFKTESGKVTCNGTIKGKTVSGAGTDENSGTATGPGGGATCGYGEGKGVDKFVVPTDDGGTVEAGAPFEFSFAFGQGQVTSDVLTATFQARPLVGDCMTTPVTKALLIVEAVIQT